MAPHFLVGVELLLDLCGLLGQEERLFLATGGHSLDILMVEKPLSGRAFPKVEGQISKVCLMSPSDLKSKL